MADVKCREKVVLLSGTVSSMAYKNQSFRGADFLYREKLIDELNFFLTSH